MWAPQKVTIEEGVRLPVGYEAEDPEGWSKEEDLASGSLEWEAEGRQLELKAEVSLDRRLIPLEAYPGVRDVAKELKEEAQTELFAVR